MHVISEFTLVAIVAFSPNGSVTTIFPLMSPEIMTVPFRNVLSADISA